MVSLRSPLIRGETHLKQTGRTLKANKIFFVHSSSQKIPYLFLPTTFSAKDKVLQFYKALMRQAYYLSEYSREKGQSWEKINW